MAWKNYSHLRLVRGLTTREYRVMSYLEEQADIYGVILRLQANTVAIECEMAINTVFLILRSLQDKKFILSREARFKANGQGPRISNGYKLDLNRYYPAGEKDGAKYWNGILKKLGGVAVNHAIDSQAFYSPKTKNLTVWLDGGRKDLTYFDKVIIKELVSIGRSHSPKIRYFDFLISLPSISDIR